MKLPDAVWGYYISMGLSEPTCNVKLRGVPNVRFVLYITYNPEQPCTYQVDLPAVLLSRRDKQFPAYATCRTKICPIHSGGNVKRARLLDGRWMMMMLLAHYIEMLVI